MGDADDDVSFYGPGQRHGISLSPLFHSLRARHV